MPHDEARRISTEANTLQQVLALAGLAALALGCCHDYVIGVSALGDQNVYSVVLRAGFSGGLGAAVLSGEPPVTQSKAASLHALPATA